MRWVLNGRLWLWAIPLLGILALAARSTRVWNDTNRSEASHVLRDQDCARCHAGIVREWTGSEHATSGDALFRRAAAAERDAAFCDGCHFGAPGRETHRRS
ncbi:MAG TPA: hypothetical protein VFK05_17005, partial [Polyangiaceae bacterium]|nr:hypothetical protein [Polyangiaceae bacterium]